MKKMRFLAIAAALAAIGFLMAGCDNSPPENTLNCGCNHNYCVGLTEGNQPIPDHDCRGSELGCMCPCSCPNLS